MASRTQLPTCDRSEPAAMATVYGQHQEIYEEADYNGYYHTESYTADFSSSYYSANEQQQQQQQQYGVYAFTEVLHVTPGRPTPTELCLYDNKMPSGVTHVTESQQTIEFLRGVVNLPV